MCQSKINGGRRCVSALHSQVNASILRVESAERELAEAREEGRPGIRELQGKVRKAREALTTRLEEIVDQPNGPKALQRHLDEYAKVNASDSPIAATIGKVLRTKGPTGRGVLKTMALYNPFPEATDEEKALKDTADRAYIAYGNRHREYAALSPDDPSLPERRQELRALHAEFEQARDNFYASNYGRASAVSALARASGWEDRKHWEGVIRSADLFGKGPAAKPDWSEDSDGFASLSLGGQSTATVWEERPGRWVSEAAWGDEYDTFSEASEVFPDEASARAHAEALVGTGEF